MARVFAVPNYKGATEGRYGCLIGAKGPEEGNLMVEASEWHSSAMRDIIADEYEIPAPRKEAILTALDAAGDSDKMRVAVARIAQCIRELAEHRSILWDADAAYDLFERIVSGKIHIRGFHDSRAQVAVDFGDAIFAVGIAAGYASPYAAKVVKEEVSILDVCLPSGVAAHRLISLADDLRLGWAVRGCAEALAGPFQDFFTTHSCLHVTSSLAKTIPSLSFYTIGFLLVICDSSTIYVLNRNARHNLAACIYSSAMWCIAGRMDERKGASAAADAGISYVTKMLAKASARRVCGAAVARSMKSSYAVTLCDLQTALDDNLRAAQRVALVTEAHEAFPAGEPWHDVVAAFDRDLRVDYGTAWNLIPPPDIDSTLLVDAVRKKVNAPREFNANAWKDFVSYSTAVITARYIHANPEAKVTWASGATEEPAWATACRVDRTRPTYPTRDERDHMVETLDWRLHLENWHHSAQDVTHVYADSTMYAKGARRLQPEEANELLYVLHNGSHLSSAYTPQSVRRCWEGGSIPGDRILYCSGKSENTKHGPKVRETMSADDVLRECLTEIDVNMATVSAYAGGVAMRAGRAGTEALIENVIKEARNGGTLFSMDVSGWSPNMHRTGELMFIDALMSMFKIPTRMRASAIFKDLTVVVDKYPCHVAFPMMDGSVQGFFGTADTIMHSMIAQYVLHEAKRTAAHPDIAEATIAKVTLIDDILFSIRGTSAPASFFLDTFRTGYARLGFEVDTVKSLVGSNTGVFLNRVYTECGEITTSAKIFAKADREWDRAVVGIYDEVSSVFAGFSGAVDRGFSVPRAYRMACIRASWRLAASAHPVVLLDKATTGMVAFLPPGMGGFGIPDVVSWITENAGGSLAAHINAITSTMRHAASTDAKVYALGEAVLNYVVHAKCKVSDAWSVATAPAAVSYDEFRDPMAIFSTAIQAAIKRKGLASDIAGMVTAQHTDRDSDCLKSILTDGTFDAPLIADYMATLPEAVGAGILSRFTKSTACMGLVGFRRAAKARQDVIHVGRLAVGSACKRIRDAAPGEDPVTPNATEIATLLIHRRCRGLGLVNTVIPAPIDVLRHVTEGGTIKVYMNHAATRAATKGLSSITRTYSCAVVENIEQLAARDVGPISSAARRLIRAVSFIAATGSSIDALVALAARVWGFDAASLKPLTVPAINPRRVSLATSSRNHTVRAYPNCTRAVAVSLDKELAASANTRTNLDYMTLRAVLNASALIDLDVADLSGMVREYIVRKSDAFLQQACRPSKGDHAITCRVMVATSVRRAFDSSIVASYVGVSEIGVAVTDEGATSYIVPDRKAANTVSAITKARGLYSAIATSSVVTIFTNAGDTTETRTVKSGAIDGAYGAVEEALATVRGETSQAIINRLADIGPTIMAAVDATKNPHLQRFVRAALSRTNRHIADDLRAVSAAISAAHAGATARDYAHAIRMASASSYDALAEKFRLTKDPDARTRALAHGFAFASATMTASAGCIGRNLGVQTHVILAAVHGRCAALLKRTGLDAGDFEKPAADSIADAAESVVRTVLPSNWADMADVVAGARFAVQKTYEYCVADTTAAPVKTVSATHTDKSAATGARADAVASFVSRMNLTGMFAGLASEPDPLDASNIIGATVRTGNKRNADDDE